MTRPLLLDAFCGAGGASMGYWRAGFDVLGVDIKPQKHYPFWFYQGDALEFIAKNGREFDVIHASPVCKGYSHITPASAKGRHPLQIPEVRRALLATGKPYVIENVGGGAPRARRTFHDLRRDARSEGLSSPMVRKQPDDIRHTALSAPRQYAKGGAWGVR